MRAWILTILIVVSVIFTQTILRLIDFNGFVPNLLLLFVVFFAQSSDDFEYLILAAAGGMWIEVLSGLPIGAVSLGLVFSATLVYLFVHRFLLKNRDWRYYFVFVVFSIFFGQLWLWIYTQVLSYFQIYKVVVDFGTIWHISWKIVVMNLIIAVPVYFISDYFLARIQNRKSTYYF